MAPTAQFTKSVRHRSQHSLVRGLLQRWSQTLSGAAALVSPTPFSARSPRPIAFAAVGSARLGARWKFSSPTVWNSMNKFILNELDPSPWFNWLEIKWLGGTTTDARVGWCVRRHNAFLKFWIHMPGVWKCWPNKFDKIWRTCRTGFIFIWHTPDTWSHTW